MFTLNFTGQFKKDLKRLKKRSRNDFKLLEIFIEELVLSGFEGIPIKHKPHKLIGNFKDCCECHVLNDLLLIWIEAPKIIQLNLSVPALIPIYFNFIN